MYSGHLELGWHNTELSKENQFSKFCHVLTRVKHRPDGGFRVGASGWESPGGYFREMDFRMGSLLTDGNKDSRC